MAFKLSGVVEVMLIFYLRCLLVLSSAGCSLLCFDYLQQLNLCYGFYGIADGFEYM
jgi:hypothetical protein